MKTKKHLHASILDNKGAGRARRAFLYVTFCIIIFFECFLVTIQCVFHANPTINCFLKSKEMCYVNQTFFKDQLCIKITCPLKSLKSKFAYEKPSNAIHLTDVPTPAHLHPLRQTRSYKALLSSPEHSAVLLT